MAYKKLIKVSNVCQLLDKSKYNPSQTINGVTFTNNGDGTFTANGTATADIDYRGVPNKAKRNIIVGHKYLMRCCPVGGSINAYYFNLPYLGRDYGNGVIAELLRDISNYDGQIIVKAGTVCDNLIFKPQLFDLTEMYGSGNEPTTVEQFRQDFPEEMYDYSPYCWLTSYKRVFMTDGVNYLISYQRNLTCKTKNLFNISSANKINGLASFSRNGNQITVSQDFGGTYISANVLLDASIVGKIVTITALAMASGLNNTYIRIQWLKDDGSAGGREIHSNIITGNSFQKLTLTGVVPEKPDVNFNKLCLMFYSNVTSLLERGVTYSATFKDIQLELGDTATDYVPYGHL